MVDECAVGDGVGTYLLALLERRARVQQYADWVGIKEHCRDLEQREL